MWWRRRWLLALAIVFVIFRLYYWGNVTPASLNQDEAAILMNAQFLAETGRDEWNQEWPIVFRSFGDAKLPGLIYTVMAIGKGIGFAPWVVRLPVFLAGLLLPLFVGVWVQRSAVKREIAIVTVLWLALSPWSWHYGTIGFESLLGLTLFMIALLLLWQKQGVWWNEMAASFLLVLAGLTYNAPWLLTPVIAVALILRRWGQWQRLGRGLTALIVSFVIVGVLTFSASKQKTAIVLWQDPTLVSQYPQWRAQFSQPLVRTLAGNQYMYWGQQILVRWTDSWSWDFLVNRGGGNPWHSIPGVGHMHPLVVMLALMGIPILAYAAWKQPSGIASQWLFLTFASLAPAVITTDAPHATRSLFFFIMLTILAAYSTVIFYDHVCQRCGQYWWWKWWRAIVVVSIVFGFAWWWSPAKSRWQQLIHPRWNAGLLESLRDPKIQNVELVSIEDPNGTLYPYAVLASNMSQEVFTASIQRSAPDTVGLVRVEKVGTYEFVFHERDISPRSEWFLQPKGNKQWDIIER